MGQTYSFDERLQEKIDRNPIMKVFLESPQEFLAIPDGPELLRSADTLWYLTQMGDPIKVSTIFKSFYQNTWPQYVASGALQDWIQDYYMRKLLEGMLGSVDVDTAKMIFDILPCKILAISKVAFNANAIKIFQHCGDWLHCLFFHDKITQVPSPTINYVLEKVGRKYLEKSAIRWTKKNDTEKLVWAFTKGLSPYLNLRETPRCKYKTLQKLATHRELKLVLITAEIGYATVWQMTKTGNLPLDATRHIWSFLHPLDVVCVPPQRLLLRQGCKRTVDLPDYYYRPKRARKNNV